MSSLAIRPTQQPVVYLESLPLRIDKGEFVIILGPKQSGKTTLLNSLGLLEKPAQGSYLLGGQPMQHLNSRQQAAMRNKSIGFIWQSANLLPQATILENVALPLAHTGLRRSRQLASASHLLKAFGLGAREYFYPHQLSQAQQQRVAIARALIQNPMLILANEPTGALDEKSGEIIMQELRDIHKKGYTVIMATQNAQLTSYADRVVKLRAGRITHDSKYPPKPKDKNAKRPLGATKQSVA